MPAALRIHSAIGSVPCRTSVLKTSIWVSPASTAPASSRAADQQPPRGPLAHSPTDLSGVAPIRDCSQPLEQRELLYATEALTRRRCTFERAGDSSQSDHYERRLRWKMWHRLLGASNA